MLTTLGVYEKIWGTQELGIDKALLISLVGFLIVFLILGILALFVLMMGKGFDSFTANKKPKNKAPKAERKKDVNKPTALAQAAVAQNAASCAAGQTVLCGVTEEEAAVIMALTSNKTGVPLNRLIFNSIKNLDNPSGEPVLTGVSDEEAAVIMALTADKLNKPLNKLRFNSIKLTEDK